MARYEDPGPWSRETETHLVDHAVAAYLDLRDAPKRHAELMRLHRDGWNMVAKAITAGLGEIAKAIRDTSR